MTRPLRTTCRFVWHGSLHFWYEVSSVPGREAGQTEMWHRTVNEVWTFKLETQPETHYWIVPGSYCTRLNLRMGFSLLGSWKYCYLCGNYVLEPTVDQTISNYHATTVTEKNIASVSLILRSTVCVCPRCFSLFVFLLWSVIKVAMHKKHSRAVWA